MLSGLVEFDPGWSQPEPSPRSASVDKSIEWEGFFTTKPMRVELDIGSTIHIDLELDSFFNLENILMLKSTSFRSIHIESLA